MQTADTPTNDSVTPLFQVVLVQKNVLRKKNVFHCILTVPTQNNATTLHPLALC